MSSSLARSLTHILTDTQMIFYILSLINRCWCSVFIKTMAESFELIYISHNLSTSEWGGFFLTKIVCASFIPSFRAWNIFHTSKARCRAQTMKQNDNNESHSLQFNLNKLLYFYFNIGLLFARISMFGICFRQISASCFFLCCVFWIFESRVEIKEVHDYLTDRHHYPFFF